jgi:hypothetical protein
MTKTILTLSLSATLVLAAPMTPATAKVSVLRPAPAASPDVYDGLALGFEANEGQAAAGVRFVAHGRGHGVALGDSDATFSSPDATVRMRFGRATAIRLEEPLPGVSNYLIGKDPSKWRTNVATYARARYESVAPGVDLVFYGTQERPEYDFVVAPGADPSAIEVRFDGASVRLDGGDLVLETAGGAMRQPRPVIYQETASGRRAVTGGYELEGSRVRFRVGAYDPSLALVIDPVLSYASYIGGNDDDRVQSAAVDGAGNLYVAGFTNSSNFPTQGALQANQSGQDGFLAKVNSSGTALLFSTYVGGSNTDNLNDVAVDGSHIYAAGSSSSNDLPTVNGYDENPNGLDAMLMVFNLSGTAVTYGTFIGGGNNDIGDAVAVDIHGNAYLGGESLDTGGIFNLNFPTKSPSSLPPFQASYGGGRSDAFVCKFDPDQSGNTSLVYSTLLGGSEGEGVEDIAVDEFERAYVCGYTESTNFDRLNAIQNTYGGGTEDGFITKFNADGTTIFYSTFYGGSAIDETLGIALDTSTGSPRPVVVGFTTSSNLQTQLPIQPSKNGPEDCFALELNDAGNAFVYATYFGGPGNDAAQAVTVDAAGNAYFTGFSNNNYPLLNPVAVNGNVATTGATMTKLSVSGTLLQSTCIATGNGTGIGVDASGNVYLAGTTSSTSFPVTPGAFQTTFHGAPNDGFVVKLDLVDDDTIGVFKPGTRQWLLRNSNAGGSADLVFNFGVNGDKPITGDWDGDGTDTIGAYSPSTGTFALRNSNSAGSPFTTFSFGAPNLIPIAGDWDGNGVASVGVFDPATNNFFLTNTNGPGAAADFTFSFGVGGQGAIPIAGDWNGDGVDTIGIYIPSSKTFLLRNQNAGGNADAQFVFGPSNATPVAGDWDGDGVDTIGTFSRLTPLIQTMVFNLRNSNSAGAADLVLTFGVVGDTPVTGNWDGQ